MKTPVGIRPALVIAIVLSAAGAAVAADVCVVLDIDSAGHATVEALTRTAGAETSVEVADRLLVCGSWAVESHLRRVPKVIEVHRQVDLDRLYAVMGHDAGAIGEIGGRVLQTANRILVAEVPASARLAIAERGLEIRLEAVSGPVSLVRQHANTPKRQPRVAAPTVQALVDQVDGGRWFADIESLASFDRYSYRDGIVQARDWLLQRLGELPGVSVTTQAFTLGSTTTRHNVLATLAGRTRPDDWYIVGGHYDARGANPEVDPAPGAEDNASGCAGVLEMARILTAHPPEGTVIFMCYAGEEQGLVGSTAHAADLVASGDDDKIRAVLDMDMIGYTADSDLDCLLETENVGLPLHGVFGDAAATYTSLRILYADYAWGSDHKPYLTRGMPALLTIENDYAQYPHYHESTDLPANISLAMGRETLKMNVAALAGLAGADGTLIFGNGFEQGSLEAWSMAP